MKKAFYRKISKQKINRWIKYAYVIMVITIGVWQLYDKNSVATTGAPATNPGSSAAAVALRQLPVKGRAPKTGYSRSVFSNGWGNFLLCDVRNYILTRDMTNVTFVDNTCKVKNGLLTDPYTGQIIRFTRGVDTSDDVQIDHVVALSDAWQKGAQVLSTEQRYVLANDPLNLLAVDGQANQDKGDSDAASWLPPNKSFRCEYVARQVAVKQRYSLWVTEPEYQAIAKILAACPDQKLPTQ